LVKRWTSENVWAPVCNPGIVKNASDSKWIKSSSEDVEQDYRNVKRIVKPMMGLQSFNTARRTLRGIEAMNLMRKGQVKGISQGDSVFQAEFINEIFGVSA
jgi:transposase-like protein